MEDKVKEIQDRFIEGISRTGELIGFSDGMARICGLLYMSPLPVSLDDICERLSLTKGTVSVYLRQLEERDIIRRAFVRNSRKKYYEIRSDLFQVVTEQVIEKTKHRIEITSETEEKSRKLIEESLSEIGEEEKEDVKLILERLSVLNEFNLKSLRFIELIENQ